MLAGGAVRTGAGAEDGPATFEMDRQLRPGASVFVRYVVAWANPDGFETQRVLDRGLVIPWAAPGFAKTDGWCTRDGNAVEPVSSPGEVVLLVHPMNRFVWAWYETWK